MSSLLPQFKIDGKLLKDYEEDFKKAILEFLQEERLDVLVDSVEEQERIEYIYKTQGSRQIQRNQSGTTIILPTPKPISVRPKRVALDHPVDLWAANPKYIRLDFKGIAHEIAWEETRSIVDALLTSGKEFSTKEPDVSTSAINEAYEWINKNGHRPDTIIIHPLRQLKLLQSKEFLSAFQFPGNTRRFQTDHYDGILAGCAVHWTPAVPQNTVLLYQKMQTRELRTPLKVEFDTYNKTPETLSVREECIAWIISDNAVAKVALGT